MKLVLKCFCTLYLFVSCSGGKKIKYLTDLEQANLKGHVTKLITKTYKIDSTGEIIKLELETIEIFNKLGYTITDTAKNFIEKNEVVNFLKYNTNGSLASLSTFENGRKQSQMLLKYDDDKCTDIQIYNANNKLENYYKNILQTKYGLLSSLNSYDANGKFTMSFVNEYDSIYQIAATAKDSLGEVTSEVRMHLTDKKYQENILEVSYFKDSTTQKFLSYKYEIWDEKGNWVKKNVFDNKGNLLQIVKRVFIY